MDKNEVKLFKKTQDRLDFVLRKTRQILIDYALLMCGMIRDKEDSLINSSLQKFDMKTILYLREERMFKMVNFDFLSEAENSFGYYRNFFVNVSKYQMAKAIEEYLFEDAIKFYLQ